MSKKSKGKFYDTSSLAEQFQAEMDVLNGSLLLPVDAALEMAKALTMAASEILKGKST